MNSRKDYEPDKGIVYSNRVHVNNWYDSSKLEEFKHHLFQEQMKNGNLMLARFRKMTDNLMAPATVTKSTGSTHFGSRVCLLAPHIASGEEGKVGVTLAGRISSNDIAYSQELENGCLVCGLPDTNPMERTCWVICSADGTNRDGENLKYNQEFLLANSKSLARNKPLYLRHDLNPIPGYFGVFPLYLSENPVSHTRWRVLPAQRSDITRFEREGTDVFVNTDMVVNHCSTNKNLGVETSHWSVGFYGRICAPKVRTCLDTYGRDLPCTIWQFYVPLDV